MSSYAFSEDSHNDIDEDTGKEFATLRRASLKSLGEKKIEPEVDTIAAGRSDEIKTAKSKSVTIRSPTMRTTTANDITNIETATSADSQGGKTISTTSNAARARYSCLGRCLRSIKNSIRRSEKYRKFQAWRRRHARERRQEIIKYYEKKVLEDDAKRYEEFEKEFNEHEKCVHHIVF